ncbi:MAG: UxaA family hydrolase [Veillonellales bacterium]
MRKQAVVIHPRDNVATATADIKKGSQVSMFVAGRDVSVVVLADIPFGHKFAIRDIPCRQHVLKYGESIGLSTADIRSGDYVHVHNVESERGRGDWEE